MRIDGGDYASIDPGALKSAADVLQRAVDGVHNSISGLKGEFASYGIDTSGISTLEKIASGLESLIPELRRRQSMARQLVAENPSGGKVAYFQGDLLGQFKTVAAAVAAAHIDAAAVQHARDHHEAVPHSVYDHLQHYGYDPDYAEAFVNEVGAKGVAYLLLDAEYTEMPGDKPDETKMSALGNTLATASYRVSFDKDYIKQLNYALRDLNVNTNATGAVNVLAPMLTYGEWSERSLTNIADTAFNWKHDYSNFDTTGSIDGQAISDIFTGFTHNPVAAGDYFSNHREDLYDAASSIRSSPVFDVAGPAYAAFIKAATIDSRSLFAQWALNGGPRNVAEQNAQWLIRKAAGDSNDYWDADMRMTFAQITKEYFPDLVYTLHSPIDAGSVDDPSRDGVNVSAGDWQKFVKLAMEDDTSLVLVGTVFQDNINRLRIEMSDAGQRGRAVPGNSPSNVADANGWDQYTLGALKSLFMHDYGDISNAKAKDAQDKASAINTLINTGIDWIADPAGIPKSLAVQFTKELLNTAVDGVVQPDKMPPPPANMDDLSGYAIDAVQSWEASQRNGGPAFTPYNDGNVTWTGDPQYYEDRYHGNFTQYIDGSTQQVDLTKLRQDPGAWAAYNAWLQDPAVQQSIFPQFSNETIGGLRDAGP